MVGFDRIAVVLLLMFPRLCACGRGIVMGFLLAVVK
jgi:hypothetical protein